MKAVRAQATRNARRKRRHRCSVVATSLFPSYLDLTPSVGSFILIVTTEEEHYRGPMVFVPRNTLHATDKSCQKRNPWLLVAASVAETSFCVS